MMFYKETEFKETLIGKIPKNWQVLKLKEVADVDTGGNAPQGEKYFKDGKHPFVRVQHFDGDKIYVDRWDMINDEAVRDYGLKLFPKDSIVFPKSGASINLEKRAMLPFASYVVNHLCVLVPHSEVIDNRFLFYAMKKTSFSKSSAGTTLPYLNLEYISKVSVPVPPMDEQEAIVGVLGVVDSVIAKTGEVIWKTERLKKGLMQTLLTRGIGHKEYKQTPIGEIPKEWKFGKLVDFSKTKDRPVQTGPFGAQLHASDYAEDGVPLILIKNVFDGQIIDEDVPRVAEKKASELTRYRLKAGDIVFSRVGSVGRAAVIRKHQEGWLVSGQMLRVRLENPEIDNEFLSYAIATNWFQKALASRTVGATRKSINTEILSNLPMVVPNLSEQRRIANIILDVDKKLELERKEKARLERIKQGLMDLLLTGKIRVKVD
ncbi:MAG: restriction endonuclease subunit S [Fervidobacterium sp.]